MPNALTPNTPADDGFDSPSSSGRPRRGVYLRWSETKGWTDPDGLPPPSPLLVINVDEVLQRWKNSVPETISDKPLPDPDLLNSAIPVGEWEIGLDGRPRPPWALTVAIYMADPAAGGTFTFMSPTAGARIAFETLKEAVVTMRILRGARVLPLVNPTERPMKTKYGLKSRPHLEVIDWRTPGDPTAAPALPPTAPPAPTASPASAPAAAPAAAPAPASAPASKSTPTLKPAGRQRSKPPVNLAAETLAAMGEVAAVTSEEIINDEIPW